MLSTSGSGKAICTCCSDAVNKELLMPGLFKNKQCLKSRQAFFDEGFDTWKNAIKGFEKHEKGELHRASMSALLNIKK